MQIRGFNVTAKFQDSVHGFPFDNKDTNWHNKFRVTVSKNGTRRSFNFYDSAHNCEQGIDALDNDALKHALYSFLSDALAGEQDFIEFCDEFGYDWDSLSAHRIWKACQRSAKQVQGFDLTEEELINLVNMLNQ